MFFRGLARKGFKIRIFNKNSRNYPKKQIFGLFYQNSRKTFTFVPFPVVLDRNPLVRLPRPETFPPWHHSTLLCTLTNNIFHEFRLDQLLMCISRPTERSTVSALSSVRHISAILAVGIVAVSVGPEVSRSCDHANWRILSMSKDVLGMDVGACRVVGLAGDDTAGVFDKF